MCGREGSHINRATRALTFSPMKVVEPELELVSPEEPEEPEEPAAPHS